MPSPKALKELTQQLRTIGQKLPSGSSFSYQVNEDHLWLERFLIPKHARGQGTAWLSKVLAATDQAGLKTALLADPTDRPGDPSTFDLVRWYGRFGFTLLAVTEDGVAMERQPRPRALAAQEIERQARAAKANDITHDEFEKMVAAAQATAGDAPVRATLPSFG